MRKILPFLLMVFGFTFSQAQSTIVTSPPLTPNNGAGGITFEVESTAPIEITGLNVIFTTGVTTANLWMRTGGVQHVVGSGPNITAANGWTQVITNGAVTGANSTALTPLSFGTTKLSIPANTRIGFYVQANVRYQTGTATDPASFTDGTASIIVANNASYGGPAPTPTNNPRRFLGSITYNLAASGSCNLFSNFLIDSVRATTAKFDWTPGTNNNSFFLEYGPSGFSQGAGTKISGTYPGAQPPVYVSGLTQSTNYDVYFGEICNASADSISFSGPQGFTTLALCPAPTNILVNGTSQNSATISLNSFNSTFDVEWGPVGFAQGTGCAATVTATNGQLTFGNANAPACLNQLQPNTTYNFYVRTNCSSQGFGGSTWQGPFAFTTACGAFTASFFNNFETEPLNFAPTCWYEVATGPSSIAEIRSFTGTAAPYSGVRALYLYSGSSSLASGHQVYSISPQLSDLTAGDKRIRMFANSDGPNSDLIIGTISSILPGGVITPIDTINFLAADTYEEVIVNFTTANGYNGVDQHIVLMHSLGATFQYVRIDDLNYEPIPACAGPSVSTMAISAVTANSAVATWGNAGQGLSTKIEWGVAGFTPGNGTSATVAGTIDTYTITGLAPQTSYEYYIQDSCAAGLGLYLGPIAFTTACIAQAGPYLSDFENFTVGFYQGEQNCWTIENSASKTSATSGFGWDLRNTPQSSSGTTTGAGLDNTLAPATGGNFFNADVSYGSAGAWSQLVSPLVDVSNLTNPILEYHIHRYGSIMADFYVDIFNGTQWINGVHSYTSNTGIQTSQTQAYRDTTINLAPYIGTSNLVRARFRVVSKGCCAGDNSLDDISFKSGPTCPAPTNISVSNLTPNAATIGWFADPNAAGYEVWHGPAGFYQGTQVTGGTVVTPASSSTTISGLSPQSCYQYLVRNMCGINGASAWVGPFTFCTPCANQLSGTYTIGPAVGNNFPTIDSAVATLNTCGISGPVTFNIAAGTYNEQILIGEIQGSSATNTVVFQPNSANTQPVIVTYAASAAADNYVWAFNGSDYVTVRGLTLTATGSTYAKVIDFSGISRNIVIENNILNGAMAATTTSTFIAVVMNNSTNTNRLEYSTIRNNQINGGSYSLYWYGVGSSDYEAGNTIDNNTMLDFYYAGIWAYYQDSLTVTNNEVISLGTGSTEYGIRHYYNDNTLSTGNKVVVSPTSTAYAYYLYYMTAATGSRNLVANNMMSALDNTGTSYGLYSYNTGSTDIDHNSILVNAGSPTGGRALYIGAPTTGYTDLKIRNNIAANTGGGLALEVTTAGVSTITASDYNNYFSSGATLANWGGTNVANLAALRTASTREANSVSGNPVFLAATDLHAIGSVANNVGLALPGITVDIDGDVRSTTTPDIGADEFTPISGDLALLAADFIKGDCLSTNDTISIDILNLIGPSVDLSTDNLTVSYAVTGPVNTSGTIVVNSGTILPSDTLKLKQAGVNLSIPGSYALSVYISSNVVNTLTSNDTLGGISLLVKPDFTVNPQSITLASSLDSTELCVETTFFSGSNGFFISEVCHFKTTTGTPVGGWPSYLTADDYIEITGVPGSDLDGITLEQWSTTALMTTFTFGPGTILSPNGTAIVAVGQMGSSVPSPANFYYHGQGPTNVTFSSGGNNGRILKDANGNIIDAVGVGTTFSFPAAAAVSAADWSGNSGSHSGMAGVRLTGPDLNNASNWVLSSISPQDPNIVNSGVIVPNPQAASGLTWTLNGAVIDSTSCIMVGPFATGGVYNYIASYANACGTFSDTVVVTVPNPMLDDAQVEEILLDGSCGDAATPVRVVFSNNGANPILTLPITVSVSGSATATLNNIYTGSLAQFGRDTLLIGTVNTVNGGTVVFNADLNLMLDQNPANDTMHLTNVFDNTQAPVPTAAFDTICGIGAFDTLYFPAGSSDIFHWLSTRGDTLGISDSLVVGPLGSSDTTFILAAQAGVTYSLGPIGTSIGAAGNFTDPSVQQLYFTAHQQFTLQEMTVFPNGNGNVNINLVDFTTNAILQTVTVPVTGVITPGSAQRIAVNMVIPAGTYKLHGGGSTTGGLWRNSAGAVYPYSAPGVVDITGHSFQASGPAYYYYFYDWKISTGGCAKPNGQITLINSGSSVNASFTVNLGSPVPGAQTVGFDATASTGATSFSWNFGDGITASGTTFQHTYISNGSFTVTLIATGPCGSDTTTTVVTIVGIGMEENELSRSLAIYPNPTRDIIMVSFNHLSAENAEIRIYDVQGRVVLKDRSEISGERFEKQISLSHLAAGVYQLEVRNADLTAQRRISVIK